MSRRWKLVRVSAEILQHMLTTGVKPAVVVDGLPPTATLDSSQYNPIFGTFELRFHDESFPEVPEWYALPTLTPTLRTADMGDLEKDAFDRGMRVSRFLETDARTLVEGRADA